MNHTGIMYLPDGVAMLILLSVLLHLRAGNHAKDATLWLVGLTFILLEGVAVGSYRSSPAMHALTHAGALGSYVLAGLSFAWAGRPTQLPRKEYWPFSFSWSLPLLAICLLYGAGDRHIGVYEYVILAALVAQLLCAAWYRRRSRTLAVFAAMEFMGWGPMLWMASRGQLRGVVYCGLGCLYLAVAVAMKQMWRRSRVGGSIVVLGFAIWSVCLFSHPYLQANSVLASVVDQVWTLQKFFVTIGLMLVMLEEERRANLELALYDPLTGLANRRLLADRLGQAIHMSKRLRAPFALFVVDLNGFKKINDAWGHEEGDRVLRVATARLQRKVRASDTLARLGGDEFAVVMNNVRDRATCDVILADLTASLNEPVLPFSEGTHTGVAGSIGYALYPDDATELDQLREIADRRMYATKREMSRSDLA